MVVGGWTDGLDVPADSLVVAAGYHRLVFATCAGPDVSFTIVRDRSGLVVLLGDWPDAVEVCNVGGWCPGRSIAAQCLGLRSSGGGAACASGEGGRW